MGIYTGLLSSSGYLVVNKAIAANIGLTETVMLAELCSEYEYWAANDGLTEDGFFYSTVENVERNTTLPDKQQRKAINKLVSLNIIEVKVIGIPPRRHFKINESALGNMLEESAKQQNQSFQNGVINSAKTEESILPKRQTNNNNIRVIKKNIREENREEKTTAKTKAAEAELAVKENRVKEEEDDDISDVYDENWVEVVRTYEQNIGNFPHAGSRAGQSLISYYKEMGADVLCQAIDITKEKHPANMLSFLLKILCNWSKDGVRTIEQAKQAANKHYKRVEQSKQGVQEQENELLKQNFW